MGIWGKSNVIFLALFLLSLSRRAHGKIWDVIPGKDFSITCSSAAKDKDVVGLQKRLNGEMTVVPGGTLNKVSPEFSDRVKIATISENQVRITLSNLTDSDSGVYWCEHSCSQAQCESEYSPGTIVVVSGDKPCKPTHSTNDDKGAFLILTITLLVFSTFLCIASLIIWLVPKIKDCHMRNVQSRPSDTIYEDMQVKTRGLGVADTAS